MSKGKIFLIEGDNDARPVFRRDLNDSGYEVSLAVDEDDALERVRQCSLQVELMLINIPGKSPADILKVAGNIAEQGKLDVLIVVIADTYGSDLAGQDVQVSEKEYITYLEEPNQLSNLLSRLLKQA